MLRTYVKLTEDIEKKMDLILRILTNRPAGECCSKHEKFTIR